MSEEAPLTGPASGGVRASDADRERAISELNQHTVAGRLSTEELEQRIQAVYAARTTGDLSVLRRDLPQPGAESTTLTPTTRRAHLRRRMIQETGGSVSLFVVCAAIWVASGAHGQFWPVWILIVVVMSAGRNAWALFGPAPDLDAVERSLDGNRERRLAREQRRSGRRRRL